MPKFSDLYVKNLPPQAARYDVREGQGFGVRVSRDGGKAFFFIYTLQGKKRRMTLGQYPAVTLKDARNINLSFDAGGNLVELVVLEAREAGLLPALLDTRKAA